MAFAEASSENEISPVFVPEIVLLVSFTWSDRIWASIFILTTSPSVLLNIGFSTSERFMVKFPDDSIEFNIPSLSKSRSKLSITPSWSESSGHILTGIIPEYWSKLKHVILPLSR